MAPETAGEVEISEVDLRYEACRVKNPRREGELLVDIQQRGIERPLAGAEDGGRWILIDGFKRLRCARAFRLKRAQIPESYVMATYPFRLQPKLDRKKVLRRYAKYDCLLIDEVGYVEVEPVQAGLFFTLMQKRHKKRTTLITSNLGFADWHSFLKNPHLTAALLDRLTETSYVINMHNCRGIRGSLEGES